MRRFPMLGAAMLSVGLLGSQARADEAKARALYEEGQQAYNVGQFDRAVDLLTRAYDEWPQTALIFNIAQGYRQKSDHAWPLRISSTVTSTRTRSTRRGAIWTTFRTAGARPRLCSGT